MAPSQEAKHYGLRLNLPGATSEAYTVTGLTGWFWADETTPVGGDGEIPLNKAREAAKPKGSSVELVEMTKREADQRREDISQHRKHIRKPLGGVTPLTADERERLNDEKRAAASKES